MNLNGKTASFDLLQEPPPIVHMCEVSISAWYPITREFVNYILEPARAAISAHGAWLSCSSSVAIICVAFLNMFE